MKNSNISLDDVKLQAFDLIERIKNNHDPDASECEKISIGEAKVASGLLSVIVDSYRTQMEAVEIFAKAEISKPGEVMSNLGIAEKEDIKMLDI